MRSGKAVSVATANKQVQHTVRWWISCPKFTALVVTDLDGILLDPPVATEFGGKSLLDLIGWVDDRWPGKWELEEVGE